METQSILVFPSIDALRNRVAQERTTPSIADGQCIRVTTEPVGVWRFWSSAGRHARRVVLPNGRGGALTLSSDANAVRNAPEGGVPGDVFFHGSLVWWLNNEGAWVDLRLFTVAASRAVTAADPGRILRCTDPKGTTLSFETVFGLPGQTIGYMRAPGAGPVTFTAKEPAKLSEPFKMEPLPEGGRGLVECVSPGVWTVQA